MMKSEFVSELVPIHFWDSPPRPLADELALEEALLQAADSVRHALVRVWEVPHYAVILGASGRIHQDVFVSRCEALSVPIYRRSSGGGTVVVGPGAYHATVIWPRQLTPALEAVDKTQTLVVGLLAQAVRQATGLAISVAGSGDLVWQNKKCAGSAQRRTKTMVMVHVSVLYQMDLEWIETLLPMPQRQPSYRAERLHSEFVTNLPVTRPLLREAIRTAWITQPIADQLPLRWDPSPWPAPIDPQVLETLSLERFANPTWIARF